MVLPTYTRSRRCIILHSNDMAEATQPLDINILHNAYIIEELLQLLNRVKKTLSIDTGPNILRRIYFSNNFKAAALVLNWVQASALCRSAHQIPISPQQPPPFERNSTASVDARYSYAVQRPHCWGAHTARYRIHKS